MVFSRYFRKILFRSSRGRLLVLEVYKNQTCDPRAMLFELNYPIFCATTIIRIAPCAGVARVGRECVTSREQLSRDVRSCLNHFDL